MPTFTYSAAQQNGQTVEGRRDAENEKALSQALKAEGLLLLTTKQLGSGVNIRSIDIGAFLSDFKNKVLPISIIEKIFFTRNLGVMVDAGLPLTRSLEALSQQTSNTKFKKVLDDIDTSVIKGKTLAESMRPHVNVFGNLFINMIEVGETTGRLTLILKLLANQMKKDYDLRKRVRGAMMYPAIIVIALLGVGTIMMLYVVPSLSATLKGLGGELPFTTQVIIGLSDALVHYSIYFLLGVVAIIFGFWRLLKTTWGKTTFDKISLRFPLLGPLVKKFNLARFARTLAYLIMSGIPIVRALEITSTVLGNTEFIEATKKAAGEVQKGRPLHEILELYPKIFQPVVIQMIKVGEETGKSSNLMLRLALFFEEDVNETTKNLSTIIEPILMIFIGLAVGFFALSVMQPIYGSLGNVQ